MRTHPTAFFALSLLFLGRCTSNHAGSTQDSQVQTINGLSSAEARDGWRLLFDGKTFDGWRGYRTQDVPASWRILNGVIVVDSKATGGPEVDLITKDMYRNFDFMVDWKVAPGANSGIMYRGTEVGDYIWRSALEMQILDDERHSDGKSPLTSAGSLFAVYPAPRGVVHPAGVWNTARILVNGNHVEHWLNGVKLFEYELGSPDFLARVDQSKFKTMPNYGKAPDGYIGLQNHGDHVEFRNIKIKVLP